MKSTYPSKILLAGEYSVLLGSDAIAVPFDYYSGAWRAGVREDYTFDIAHWVDHLNAIPEVKQKLDLERMRLDYHNDIRFVSNIPQGGGLGSSGSVTAAFYDRYVYDELSLKEDLADVRRILSQMESYFHGESSGVDPLVSLSGRSYATVNGEGTLIDSDIPSSISLHIVMTSAVRNTAPLIEYFRDSMTKRKFPKRMQEEQIPAVHDFVTAWLDGRVSDVENAFNTISEIEWDICKPMITREIKPLWQASLESDEFSIKLCGAGGGGAYLACGKLPEDLELKTLPIR